MTKTEVYVGMGGNIGNTYSILLDACQLLSALPQLFEFRVSSFYETKPVSDIPQRNFLNAVCSFYTTFTASQLMQELKKIEISLGKVDKPKMNPRVIDLDLLLFGQEMHNDSELTVPHPRWMERLFVLQPLADLTDRLWVPSKEGKSIHFNVREYLSSFPNVNNEDVKPRFS